MIIYRKHFFIAFSAGNCVVKTRTSSGNQAASTTDDIYLTMYDVNGNACETTLLENGQDVFVVGA